MWYATFYFNFLPWASVTPRRKIFHLIKLDMNFKWHFRNYFCDTDLKLLFPVWLAYFACKSTNTVQILFTRNYKNFFFAFAFVCPLPGHILCVLPHFNKHKYLEKKVKFKMKELAGSLKLQIFICTTWIPLGFDGQTGTFLCWSSSRVPVSLSPACSPWSTTCFTHCLETTTSWRKKLFPKHDSAPLRWTLSHPEKGTSSLFETHCRTCKIRQEEKKNIVIRAYSTTH